MLRPQELRVLYKHLLRNVARFPSKKRVGLLQDVRVEFRENMHITDEKDIKHQQKLAIEGLQTLKMYTEIDAGSQEWLLALGNSM
jgi:hypothetical protein